MTDNKARVLDVIDHITSGRLLEGFEKHYASDCVLSENNEPEQTRHGKDANRQYEEYFVANAEFHGVEVEAVIGDGPNTAYQMTMDFTFGGQRITRTQWAVQQWNSAGQIERETFFYSA